MNKKFSQKKKKIQKKNSKKKEKEIQLISHCPPPPERSWIERACRQVSGTTIDNNNLQQQQQNQHYFYRFIFKTDRQTDRQGESKPNENNYEEKIETLNFFQWRECQSACVRVRFIHYELWIKFLSCVCVCVCVCVCGREKESEKRLTYDSEQRRICSRIIHHPFSFVFPLIHSFLIAKYSTMVISVLQMSRLYFSYFFS